MNVLHATTWAVTKGWTITATTTTTAVQEIVYRKRKVTLDSLGGGEQGRIFSTAFLVHKSCTRRPQIVFLYGCLSRRGSTTTRAENQTLI